MSAFADETSRDSASPFILWGKALLDDPKPPCPTSFPAGGREVRNNARSPRTFWPISWRTRLGRISVRS